MKEDFEFIAASFTRSAEDIVMIRNELEKTTAATFASSRRFENTDGVENIDDIIRVSTALWWRAATLASRSRWRRSRCCKKQLIHKAYVAGKQVITATQMLDSMIKNPRPDACGGDRTWRRTRSTTARAPLC